MAIRGAFFDPFSNSRAFSASGSNRSIFPEHRSAREPERFSDDPLLTHVRSLFPDWPEVLVKPVEALTNRAWTRKGAVPTLVDHLLFVVARRAEEVEERTLR